MGNEGVFFLEGNFFPSSSTCSLVNCEACFQVGCFGIFFPQDLCARVLFVKCIANFELGSLL